MAPTFAGGLAGDVILVYLIGLCPLLALSRKFEAALGLGMVTLLMAPPAALLGFWLAQLQQHVILALPLLVAGIFVAVYAVARLLARFVPGTYGRVEVYVPMMAVSCTLLGIVLIAVHEASGSVGAAVRALTLAAGYALVLVVVAQLRERLVSADIPAPFRGAPIALITLGILALALAGFTGLRPL